MPRGLLVRHPLERGPGFLDISRINDLLAEDSKALTREMARVLDTDHPFLKELAERILQAPGKQLRPKLLMLCAKMLGYDGPHAPLYGLVFELVHTATLVHDDIIDEARTRRGKTTLNHELGNTLTVLYGDLLYTKAHSTAIEAGRLDVLDIITWVSERMIEGELLQHKVNFKADISEADYFDILERKTAYLFAGTTKAAGLITDRSPEDCEALFQFGFNFGVSFQLMDDWLNYTGDQEVMGKPVLSDLKDGKITLPVIKLLKDDDGAYKAMIRKLWDEQDESVVEPLMDAVQNHHGLHETWDLAEQFAKKAVAGLDGFPDNTYGQILRGLPLYLLNRKK